MIWKYWDATWGKTQKTKVLVQTWWVTLYQHWGHEGLQVRLQETGNTDSHLTYPQTVKRLPTMQETRVLSLGREDPQQKEMATRSSILAWKIPWTEKPGCLLSMGSRRVRHNWSNLAHTMKVKVKSLSCVRLFATPWTVAYQDPRSMGFSRQEYWSGLPFPSPGDLPNPEIKPRPPSLQADSLPSDPLVGLGLVH